MKHDTLDIHFAEFLDKFTKIEIFESEIRQSTEAEFRRIEANRRVLEQKSASDRTMSINNMFYMTLSGEHVFYDFRTRGIEDLQEDLAAHINKQYSWLLTEAFEAFEMLVNAVYAHIGFNNPSDWPPKELRRETIESVQAKQYEWFSNKAAENRDLSKKLACIRTKLPRLSTVEAENSYNMNFRLAIPLIETMRHIIVHNSGRIKNRESFIEKILGKAGLSKAGNFGEISVQHIQNFIARNKDGYFITMLEIPSGQPMIHYSRLSTVLNWLLAYSDFIVKTASPKCAKLSHYDHFIANGT